MKYEWLDGYLLSFPGAEKRWHPGWKMFLYEVRGKQFAAVCAPEEKYQTYGGHELVNLKCDPRLAEGLREQYSEILPGFYCDTGANCKRPGTSGNHHNPTFDLDESAFRRIVEFFAAFAVRFLGE